MSEPAKPVADRLICLQGIEIKTDVLPYGYVSMGLSKPRPGSGYDLWARTATMHPEEAEILSRRLHELAGRTCAMCDGREPVLELGERCLELLIEERLAKMIKEGALDDQLQKVLDRYLARASVPAMGEDHELVDPAPVPYDGVD